MLPVEQPFKTYTGLDGKPLDNGYVYFGQPNQNPLTAPVTVFWDAAGTIPAAQPLRTVNGYIMRAGTPANIFFGGAYSELVQDSKRRQVFYARTSDDFSIASAVTGMASALAATDGTNKIGHGGITLKEHLDILAFGVTDIKAPATSAQIQAKIDAALGGLIRFHGVFTLAEPITLKNGLIYEGLGVDIDGDSGTKMTFTCTTDAVKIANPLNGSTSANIEIRGIWFASSTLTKDCALLFDTASSVVVVRRCRFNSSGVGIILDQSEMWDIELCSFNCATGIWLVNGPDKQLGSQPFFTNRIGVRVCEFNGGPTAVGVYDDGGVAHTYQDNNFNACGNHIIATGVTGLKLDGGEYEISAAQSIICGTTKRKGGAGGKSSVVSINRLYLYNTVNQPVLAMVAGAVGKLEFANNVLNTVPGAALSGLDVGCDEIDAHGNVQTGTGSPNYLINNHIDLNPAPVDWVAAGGGNALGNGELVGNYSRRGKLLSFHMRLVIGSTTALGSGGYSFPLPFPADTSAFSQLGSCYIVSAGTGCYTGITRVTTDGRYVELYIQGTAPVGTGNPALPAGSYLEFTALYKTASPI